MSTAVNFTTQALVSSSSLLTSPSTEMPGEAANNATADTAEAATLTLEMLAYNMNIFFVITVSMIIFLMQAGFAFLEAGCVRSKNTTNILLKNLLDSAIAAIAYWAVGYAFAFGEGNAFIGYSGWFGTYPKDEMAKWFFQMVFCATAATIISGAVAERCHFVAYLSYSFLLSAFCYPVVTRWAWHSASKPGDISGWLADGISVAKDISFQDFAGSGVVHVCGGMSALIGAVFIGPRIGYLDKTGKAQPIAGHSIPLAALGGLILMFGFCAFNGGSQFYIARAGDGDAVARAVVNTLISGSAAGLATLLVHRLFVAKKNCIRLDSHWSLLKTLNGILGGMVAICGGANVMEPWGSFLTGVGAGVIYYFSAVIIPKLKIDDPLDAVAVHFCCGSWGLIAAPLFDGTSGILVTGSRASFTRLGVNILGWLVIGCWTAALCSILFAILRATKCLRVPPEAELKGLDVYLHNEPSYPGEAYEDVSSNGSDSVSGKKFYPNNLSSTTLSDKSRELHVNEAMVGDEGI